MKSIDTKLQFQVNEYYSQDSPPPPPPPPSPPQKETLQVLNRNPLAKSTPIQMVSLLQMEKSKGNSNREPCDQLDKPHARKLVKLFHPPIPLKKLPFCLERLSYESIKSFLKQFEDYEKSCAGIQSIQQFIAPYLVQVLISRMQISSMQRWLNLKNIKVIEILKTMMWSDSIQESIYRLAAVKANFKLSEDPATSFLKFVSDYQEVLDTIGEKCLPSQTTIIEYFHNGLIMNNILPKTFFLHLKERDFVSLDLMIDFIKASFFQIRDAMKTLIESKIVNDTVSSEWWRSRVFRAFEANESVSLSEMNNSIDLLALSGNSETKAVTLNSDKTSSSCSKSSSSSSEYLPEKGKKDRKQHEKRNRHSYHNNGSHHGKMPQRKSMPKGNYYGPCSAPIPNEEFHSRKRARYH